MHEQAFTWLARTVRWEVLPEFASPPRVLEVGSLDVNGSPRALFPDSEYVGVDRVAGKGVDVICDVADLYTLQGDNIGLFDMVVSTETLEHMPLPATLLVSAWQALKPGGFLLLTAAAPPRQPHRCDGSVGDLRGEHYENIRPDDLRRLLVLCQFTVLDLLHDADHGDVYVLARKLC